MEKGHLPRSVTSFRFGEMKKVLLEKGGKFFFTAALAHLATSGGGRDNSPLFEGGAKVHFPSHPRRVSRMARENPNMSDIRRLTHSRGWGARRHRLSGRDHASPLHSGPRGGGGGARCQCISRILPLHRACERKCIRPSSALPSLTLSLLPFTRVSISSPAHFLPELQISPPPPGDGVTYASGKKERISTALYVLFQSSSPPKKVQERGKSKNSTLSSFNIQAGPLPPPSLPFTSPAEQQGEEKETGFYRPQPLLLLSPFPPSFFFCHGHFSFPLLSPLRI